MDQSTLVNVDLDAGATLVSKFAEFVPVKVAFWVRQDDQGWWKLCIALEQLSVAKFDSGYAKILQIAKELRDPNIDPFRVVLLPTDDRVAMAAFALADHTFASLRPIHLEAGRLEGASEAFIYPVPGPLDTWSDVADSRWEGVAICVFDSPQRTGEVEVEFQLRQLQHAIWPGGQARRVPRPAKVRVSGPGELRVTGYDPPEQPLPHITQKDYERKAVQEVTRLESLEGVAKAVG